MVRNFLKGVALGLLMLPISAMAENVDNLVSKYLKHGNEIVDMVNTNSIDVDKIKSLVEKQTVLSVKLLDLYTEKFPNGKGMLNEVKMNVATLEGNQFKALGPMKDETFDHIEKHWHDMGFMEGAKHGVDMEDEDNEHFSDPAHVAIHPLMTLRAAMEYKSTGDDKYKETIKAETQEGMEQAELLIEALE